jgi:hypothetical protein
VRPGTAHAFHGRAEAILELDADTQIRQGLIHFLRPDEEQTRKRREVVPICPTLAPWLEGIRGKVIVNRARRSKRRGPPADRTSSSGQQSSSATASRAWCSPRTSCIRISGSPAKAIHADGKQIWLEPRWKLGEAARPPKMVGIGSPNTLRHTIHTWHERQGVPEAQIDAAAGHSKQGTGASYTHLRPTYLKKFIDSTEAFWAAVGEFTESQLRYKRRCARWQPGPSMMRKM